MSEVIEVRAGSAAEALKIFIQPSAKLSAMQEVAVLLYEPPPRPEFDKSLPNAGKKKYADRDNDQAAELDDNCAANLDHRQTLIASNASRKLGAFALDFLLQ